MRKSTLICVLMITVLLCACGAKNSKDPMELALAVRGEYLAARGCTARAEITADYGQRIYRYTVDIVVQENETTLTVIAPQEVAGITARLRGANSALVYEDCVLETGPLSPDGLTPLSAAAALLDAARSGFIDSCGIQTQEGRELLYLLCRDPSAPPGCGRQIALWMDQQDHSLLRGEISWDGRQVISCSFTQFSLTSSTS